MNFDDITTGVYNEKRVRAGFRLVDTKTGKLVWAGGRGVRNESGTLGSMASSRDDGIGGLKSVPGITEIPRLEEWETAGEAADASFMMAVGGKLLDKATGGYLKAETEAMLDKIFRNFPAGPRIGGGRSGGASPRCCGGRSADAGLREGALRDAMTKAMTKMIDKLNSIPFQGRVLEVESGVLIVRAGSKSKLQSGTVFGVYRPGKDLVDPDTGRVIGKRESQVGEVVLTSHQGDNISEAKIKSGTGFKVGDIVRVMK